MEGGVKRKKKKKKVLNAGVKIEESRLTSDNY